jgi:hypothetical protein
MSSFCRAARALTRRDPSVVGFEIVDGIEASGRSTGNNTPVPFDTSHGVVAVG